MTTSLTAGLMFILMMLLNLSTPVAQPTTNVKLTGLLKGSQSMVVYEGKPFSSFTPCFWRVYMTYINGRLISSPIACFETGKMIMDNWKGAWISDGQGFDQPVAPYIRKYFRLFKTVRSTRAYVFAGVLLEMNINGRKEGDHQLPPAYTRFDRRLLYMTFDVTSLLHKGDIAAGFLLGNGWSFHQSMAIWNFDKECPGKHLLS